MLVKICGLTNLEDTLAAMEFGADFLGFNFYPESPRFLGFEEAEKIFQEIPSNLVKVGLFVNEEYQTIIDIAAALNLDMLQFHGDETPEFCNQFARAWIPALRVGQEEDLQIVPQYESDWILVDASVEGEYGGTGVKANWPVAKQAKKFGKKLMLAGGLNPENVQTAIATVQPDAVDVSSGVELKIGRKDFKKMEEFIERAKSVSLRLIETL